MDTQDLQRLKNKFDIIGNDPGLNQALEMAEAVATTDLTVLVTGESGVGKDVVPRIIHQYSLRKNGKYLAVNCAAIPEGTVDSELFGHEKGSFTGAVGDRKGYFEEADGGTLFLDEVGELPLATQAKLLRVLQSGEYIRVGASKVSRTNVRVIAATNVDLLKAVAKGKFRQDLYYRLGAIQIYMPPLRERKEDIHLLFRKFTSDFSERYSRRKVVLTRDAVELLTSYRWPGNVRELQSLANRVSVFESFALSPSAEKCEISAATLRKYLPQEDAFLPVRVSEPGSHAMSDEERQEIFRAIAMLGDEVSRLRRIVEQRPAGGWRNDAIPGAGNDGFAAGGIVGRPSASGNGGYGSAGAGHEGYPAAGVGREGYSAAGVAREGYPSAGNGREGRADGHEAQWYDAIPGQAGREGYQHADIAREGYRPSANDGGVSYPQAPDDIDEQGVEPAHDGARHNAEARREGQSKEPHWQGHAAEPEESLSIRGASEDLIRKALEKHDGNRKKAAEELGISERTLYRKLPPEFRTSQK